jgi:hypothetical protein
MKAILKLKQFTFIVLILGVFTACQDKIDQQVISTDDSQTVQEDLELQSLEDASLDVAVESMEGELAKEGETDHKKPVKDLVGECATITIVINENQSRTVTIDFGSTGCVGRDGRLRTGKIITTYNKLTKDETTGTRRITTFENHTVNGVLVEGTRTLERIAPDENSKPRHQVTITGGKLTFADQTITTWSGTIVRTWIAGLATPFNLLDDEFSVTRTITGINRRGVAFTHETVEPLIWKSACLLNKVRTFVQGILKLSATDRENDILIDFGSGTCDNNVIITIGDKTFFFVDRVPQ